jgi:hypothetical protein
MDEATFLKHYADDELKKWWKSASPAIQEQMLGLLTGLHATPLSQLDQFTVGLHTHQPDGWTGSRLVFAIRNNKAANGQATGNTICLSLALNTAGITASVNYRLNLHQPGKTRVAHANELLPLLQAHLQRLQDTVDDVVQHRKVNGRACPQRAARMPFEYE